MHEIEIKAAVRNKEGLVNKLAELGCVFSEAITQDDTVYAKNVSSITEFVKNSLFLRIRAQSNGKVIFTVKHHEGRDANDPTGVPVEHELEVSSRDTMEQMLMLLDFKEAARVKKTRQKCLYKEWELCIDEVEGLGTFIEVEQMATFEEAEAIQKNIIDFLLSLGIEQNDIPAQRYDIALMEKSLA
ncbi:class IV adenylate cyclase [Patescibacteria group bacterium]|nr:class IV adenylate cyclase [Patescibacteria group bacterium]MBU1500530.1 class IV adenylate cyclase [Patescibacteria group bacterium]MBU2080419.1 class IV adenylate cyclase [Patescibacteria group bacterium]MBU2123776.1 class IV adenylate cyclase [Patescibacteria group bacterium]MBU2194632.1 class IV adenylate cyclase [Patescibacteria group bacterium]